MKARDLLCLGFLVSILVGFAHAADGIRIVQDGRPRATVVLPNEPDGQTEAAARLLIDYIQQSTGAELPLLKRPAVPPDESVAIHVGGTELVHRLHQDLDGLDDDGFVIHGVNPSQVLIAGPTPYGTEFGVYEFLERYVGVRWLMPGPDGEDVPRQRSIEVPVEQISQEPAIFSRLFSGLRGNTQTQWARFNRMHGRVSFHHYLLHVFPPTEYTKTHPDFFPMKDGKSRFLPPTNDTHGWQPCFSNEAAVQEAIRNITRFFDDRPGVPSFSLGVNDSSGHCRCPSCLEHVPAEPNFLGRADYSDLYYGWCNQVIEGVLKKHPDKWFGCLAYSEVAAPPQNVTVHERLIPYMTYDRMKWIHPEIKAASHAATDAWAKASPTLGWYDYIYGTPYCLPRVYFHEVQEYVRYGAEKGVRACYAEIYPNWGEGPKPYLFLKLWWNPDADVDALLNDWYERCVGPDAAPYLAEYYSIWERFWTQDILDSKWFSTRGQYLSFNNPAYLADVRLDDVIESRRLLDTCIDKCRTDQQRARAGLLEKAFQYYEASALAYLADRQLPPEIRTEQQALDSLNSAETAMRMAKKRRHLALEVYPDDPVLVHPISIERFGVLSGETWGGNGMWAAMDWVAKGDNTVRKRVADLATSSESSHVRDQASLMLAIVDDRITPVSPNGSFEEGNGNLSPHWSYWVKPDPVTRQGVGRMLRSTDHAHDGNYSLLCDRMYRGGPVHTIKPLPPGNYCALAWVYVDIPEGTECSGTCELAITPRGDDGTNLPGLSAKITPPRRQWTLIVAGGRIEQEIKGKTVTHALMIPIVDGFREVGKVYWDEVALYRIKDRE